MSTATTNPQIAVCLALTRAIGRARTLEGIYAAALDALDEGLGVSRASILMFDPDQVMRFKASRGLSETYRRAVEGHTPWTPDSPDPQPIVVADVLHEPSLEPFRRPIADEGIRAMAFIPLVALDRVVGKFMLYYDAPCTPTASELQLAGVIAAQVAFATQRAQAEAHARRSEERLRFALDAASMGTWEWDLSSHEVRWSDNLERIHGLPPGTFDATFASYEREIHPEDLPPAPLARAEANP
jgi:GAF domain-containing protein